MRSEAAADLLDHGGLNAVLGLPLLDLHRHARPDDFAHNQRATHVDAAITAPSRDLNVLESDFRK